MTRRKGERPLRAPFVTSLPVKSGDTALAGKDGKQLAKLIREAKDRGAETLYHLTRKAVGRYRGIGPLLNPQELDKLAESLASVNATADLLGRFRVREISERAQSSGGISQYADDVPWSSFADALPRDIISTPEEALSYFLNLTPSLGIDAGRFAGEQRRRAFTLAASTNQVLTARVQDKIGDALRRSKGVSDAIAEIQDAFKGEPDASPTLAYAEMVYRTNANDSFQTATYEEGRHPDVLGVFPVWQYLIVDDERTGEDHRPKGNRYYPADATFAEVRGNRPYNCRCGMRWVDFMDWERLQARGFSVERRW